MASERQTGRTLVLNNFTKWSSFLLALLILSIIGATLMATDSSLIVELLHEPEFGRAVLFSLNTSVIATLLAAITAVPAGLYLARNKTLFTHIIDALFDIPIVMPPLVVGVLLLSFFNLELIKTIYNFIFTPSGAIIAQFFVAMPFTVRASKNTFELISPTYEQMAMTLGATPARALFDTTIRMEYGALLPGLTFPWPQSLG